MIPIFDFVDLSATTTHAASCRPLDDRVGFRKGRTDAGERPNTSADSELTQRRKGGAGNAKPARSAPNARFSFLAILAATTSNAACYWALDGEVRMEYDPKENF